ncbi:MAG: tetratricopeptide repeat protein [Anaerolineaceae bacterium]
MAGDQEAFTRAMKKGHSAAWDMNWEEAARQYSLAINEFPGHVMALSGLAMSLVELKDYDTALRSYKEAVRLSPQDPILMENTARLLDFMSRMEEAAIGYTRTAELFIQIRELPKAAANLERLITIQSGNLRARSRLAQIYEHQGKSKEAVDELLITAGIVQSSNPDKARQVVEYALHIQPDSKEAVNALEAIRNNKKLPGRVEKPFIEEIILGAEALFPKLEKEEREPEADPIQAAQFTAVSRMAELVIDYRPAGDQNSRDKASLDKAVNHANSAVEAYSQGQVNQTINELEEAINAGLDSPPAWFLAGSLQKSFQPAKALIYLEKSENSLDFALASFLTAGTIYQNSGKLREAHDKLLKAFILADMTTVPADKREMLENMYAPITAVQMNQRDSKAVKNTCEIIISQLMRPDWRAYFTAARSHMPVQSGNRTPLPLADMLLIAGSRRMVEGISRARNLTGQGQYNAALDALYYELKVEPDFLPAHEQIADLLFQKKQIYDAVTKYLLIEKCYELRGEVNQAIRLMLRVEQMVPANLEVRNRLIELYFTLGRVDEAIQHYLDLADMYYHMADLEKARQTYLAVLRLSQKSRQNRTWTGKILHKIADIDMQRLEWREAIRILEQIRTMIPEDDEARASLVELNFRLGQDEAALAELDSAVAFFEKNQQVPSAVEFIVNAIIQRPEKRDLRSRLLVLSNRIGDVTAIVENLDHKADRLVETGNKPGAVSLLEVIISLYPPNVEDYKKVLENIKSGR